MVAVGGSASKNAARPIAHYRWVIGKFDERMGWSARALLQLRVIWLQTLLSAALVVCSPLASAVEPEAVDEREYRIGGGPLGEVLAAFTGETGIQLVPDANLIRGKTSPGLVGTYSLSEGFAVILAGTGLHATRNADGTYALAPGQFDTVGDASERTDTVIVSASQEALVGALPDPYPGGQVARGAQAGMLGNLDYMNMPFSITSYTSTTMEDQQARTLTDVMANDASVRNFYSQTFPQDSFFIRGFQVLSDDFAFGGLYGVLPLFKTTIAAADRVEVLRGPNAFLNGMSPSGNIGGAINVVPKRASDDPLTRLTASYDSDAQFGGHIDVGRRFGADNRFGIRFNGVYYGGDTSVAGNSQQLGQLLLGLDYRGERLRVSSDLGYQRQDNNGIEGALFLAGVDVPDAPDAQDRFFQHWLYNDNHDYFGALRAELDLATNVTAFAAFGGREHWYEELYAYGDLLDAQGNFRENFGFGEAYFSNRTGQAGIRGRFETGAIGHKIVLSGSLFRQRRGVFYRFGSGEGGVDPIFSNIYSPNFIPKPSLAALPDDIPKVSETHLSSIGLADTLSFARERVQLTIGIRSQEVETESFDTATGDSISKYDKRALSPALGLTLKVNPKLSLYGNYIEGLSAGPIAPAGTVNAGQVFAPLKSRQYEAGAKLDLGRLGATVALFQIQQPSSLVDASNVFTVNGEQRNRGIELGLFGEAARSVRLLGGLMWLDSQLLKTQDGTNDGNEAPNAPRLNLNFGVEWDTPFVRHLTLTGRVIYTSTQFVDQGNTQEIPSWTRFDIGARYLTVVAGKPVTLRASVENVFNASYWSNSSLFRGAPRTFLLSTAVDF